MSWAPDYCTVAEIKSYLRITDTADDVLLAAWITAASRAVDSYCGRQFGSVAAETRTWTAQYDRSTCGHITPIDDLMTTVGVTVTDESGTAVTDYELWPRNAVQKGRPWTQLRTAAGGALAVFAPWGWTAVPTSVHVATMLQVGRLNARRDSPYGVAGSPSEGSEVRLLAVLDPDLKTSLQGFRRQWWAT